MYAITVGTRAPAMNSRTPRAVQLISITCFNEIVTLAKKKILFSIHIHNKNKTTTRFDYSTIENGRTGGSLH